MSKSNGKSVFGQIETERLLLEPIGMPYQEFVFNHFSDPVVTRFMVDEEPLTDMEGAAELIEFYTSPKEPRHNRWVLVTKSDSTPIGTCGYHKWNGKDNIAEIGYDLSPAYWGKGYMTEALKSATEVGFESMKLNRIQAFVDVNNIKSVSLAKRLGFTREGTVRDKHLFRGKYYDHYMFSLLRREWK
ncbi:MAG: GNAT family N-acetyltransferase [Chloroflexi bacterium]|nr:GNAT family N-acetyltransferase [Chloroflexota bacterium]MBT7082014.1 GNAT family N-acetyltransferase [Chloroflexota bacterium]MBT7289685.1 GNAT family N-acetyltransferase [Chloroflexota bacterium]